MSLMLDNLMAKFTNQWRQVDWGRTLLLALLILACFAALWQYAMPQIQTISTTEFKRVTEIQKVDKIQRVLVPGPVQVVTIEKTKVVEKLILPPEVAADPNKQVITTGDLPASEAGFETATVLDVVTGESFEVSKEKVLPFFGLLNNLTLGAYYGISTAAAQMGQVDLRYRFARTGPLKWELMGEVNTRPEAKALAGFTVDLLK